MTNHTGASLDRLGDQIGTADALADADREVLLDFSDRLDLLPSEYSTERHEKLLRHCAIMAGLSQQVPVI